MKILAFSDTHLRDSGSFQPFNRVEENGFSRELNNILLGFKFVADAIKKVKPEVVILPGDLFHTPEGLTTSVIHAASIALGYIRDACIEVSATFYIMPGNHDCLNDKLGIYSISTLLGFGTLLFDNTIIDHGGFRIGIVQFNTDKGIVAENLATIAPQCDLLVTHLDFKGARYETGEVSTSSVSPNLGIPCISGDIHLPQEVGDVWYIGSLVQNRFNRFDLDGVGGVLIYDFDSKKFTRHKNNLSKHYVKIEDPSQLKGLAPERVVLQVRCPIPDAKTNKLFEPYEYVHLPIPEKANHVNVAGQQISMERPEQVLRKFVSEHRPGAMSLLDEVLGGEINA